MLCQAAGTIYEDAGYTIQRCRVAFNPELGYSGGVLRHGEEKTIAKCTSENGLRLVLTRSISGFTETLDRSGRLRQINPGDVLAVLFNPRVPSILYHFDRVAPKVSGAEGAYIDFIGSEYYGKAFSLARLDTDRSIKNLSDKVALVAESRTKINDIKSELFAAICEVTPDFQKLVSDLKN